MFILMVCLACWGIFAFSFTRDRSRYRNCYLLFLALFATFLVLFTYLPREAVILVMVILAALLIVPFFLIHNGIVMLKKEGRCAAHLLSLFLGLAVLIGELATFYAVFGYSFTYDPAEAEALYHTGRFIAGAVVSETVIYGSMAFVIFMVYTLFLQIIPRKRDFDFVIIHGAGLIDGERVSKLLQDRLDKAIDIYRKDPTPPKMIPSGGRGDDENISEAEAMRRYLLEKGIPEDDIILEDKSTTTMENIGNSKRIVDSTEGRKYTALVTSNYHVYRALRYGRKVGLVCIGIGSPVAFYYWPSALIREFIAIHAEKKHALWLFAGWLLCTAALVRVLTA